MTNSPTFLDHMLGKASHELAKSNIRKSLSLLRVVSDKLENNDIRKRIDDVEARYFYMLRFLSTNPQSAQGEDTESIINAVKGIIEDIRHLLSARENTLYAAQIRFAQLRPEENLQSIISDYLSEADRLHTDVMSFTDARTRAKLERLATDIFNRLWTIYRLDSETIDLIIGLIDDNGIEASHRELWVNALGMALTYRYDKGVIGILQAALTNTTRRISIAAAVWLTIAVSCFGEMLGDDDTAVIVAAMRDGAGINIPDIYETMIQNLDDNANDFFTDIASLSQKFRNINPTSPEALKNIDLNSDDYDRIKRFNEAQASGADVFGRSLGRMRQFPFFATLANWFLPFESRHSALADITDGEGAEIADTISRVPNLADSDKYAMLLSMSQMPPSMRAQSLTSLVDGMRSVSDSAEYREAMDAIANIPDKALIANHIHGLTRFINFFPKVSEFPLNSVWKTEYMLDIDTLDKVLDINQQIALTRFMAKRGSKYDIIGLFDHISDKSGGQMTDQDYELFADHLVRRPSDKSKLDKAAEIYSMLLNRDPLNLNISLKLAETYLAGDTPSLAIDTLLQAGIDKGNDTVSLEVLADAYMQAGKLDEAIMTLHQIDYILPPDNNSIKIKLAHAYLAANLPDEAASTIGLVPSDQRDTGMPGREGIILWLSNNPDEAFAVLERHLHTGDETSIEKYISSLRDSIDSLTKYPVSHDKTYPGLKVLPDILMYRLRGSQFGNL